MSPPMVVAGKQANVAKTLSVRILLVGMFQQLKNQMENIVTKIRIASQAIVRIIAVV